MINNQNQNQNQNLTQSPTDKRPEPPNSLPIHYYDTQMEIKKFELDEEESDVDEGWV